jgi:heat shock protein HslJ
VLASVLQKEGVMRWIGVLLMAVAAAGVGASRADAGQGQATSHEILDIDWLVQSIAGHEAAEGVVSTVRLGSDGRVTGDAGCNRFGGSYTIEGERLEVGPLAATKRMCPDEIMTQEDRFLELLGTPLRFELTAEGFLVLYPDDEGEPTRLVPLSREDHAE